MNTTMKDFIDNSMQRQIADLQELVRIPSVSRGDPRPGMPLGEQVAHALRYTLNLARRLGFTKVWDLDGYCGIVEYGEGEECLGIMAHLDVVPEGTGWTYPPYGAEIHNGRMYGRGTVDDKGAAVSALYALAAVKDCKIPLKRRVRLILGCDEERGWACMEHYKRFEEEPTLAFTPDAEYPVVHSEMGIMQAAYFNPTPVRFISEVGTAPNVIPGEATVSLLGITSPQVLPEGYTLEYSFNQVKVTGKGGHASMPELGLNALQGLLCFIRLHHDLSNEEQALADGLFDMFKFDLHGESLGIDVTDDSGRTTCVPSMFTANESGVSITIDCRYPFSLSEREMLLRLDTAFGSRGFVRKHYKNTDCHFVPADSELVTALMEIFNRNAKVNAEPMKIGGGTYARAFKNAVAFGTVPYLEESPCHMPDESVGLSDIRFNTVVIAEAIERLAGAEAAK
ncbi:MAG: Sapep family Mn(2+)-dependent dipeptidase [Clostridia bacterium]|nr:Sapep family Mn(2+)-dependent dipeptidase [Clostridia bacterium]